MSNRERLAWRVALLAIVATALLLRLAYLQQFAALPFFDQPVGDSAIYLGRAREIVAGAWLPAQPFFYGSVLYPYFLAIVLGPAHGTLYTVALCQVLAGSLLVASLALLARRLYGVLAGVGTGILAALYGPMAFMEADVLGVVWGLLAMAGGIYLCHAWLSRQWSDRRLASLLPLAIGVAFGLSATERPNLLVLVPLVAGWCAWNTVNNRARAAVAVLLGAVLPVSLYLILNVAGTGQWVPLTTSSGINLSIGYHAGADGAFREPWEREAPEFTASHTELGEASRTMASMKSGREMDAKAASRYWRDAAIRYVQEHPLEAAALTLRKTALLLNNVEVPNHLNFEFIQRQASVLALMPVRFGIVFVLGMIGFAVLIFERRRLPETSLLLLLLGGSLLSVVPFFVADRYRLPLVLPLLIAAGVGAAAVLSILRRHLPGGRRGLLLVVLVGLGSIALTIVPLSRPIEGRDYWMLAQAYEAKGALPAAIEAYEAAVRADSTNATLLNNLGGLYRRTQQRELAAATFRRAIAVDDQLVLPHRNLGMTLITMGDFDGALQALRRADQLSPADPQTLGAIGALLAERGETAASADTFALALRLAPLDRSIRGLLSNYPDVAERIAADSAR